MIFYKLQFTFEEADCDFLSALLITCQAEFLLSLLRTDAPRVTPPGWCSSIYQQAKCLKLGQAAASRV